MIFHKYINGFFTRERLTFKVFLIATLIAIIYWQPMLFTNRIPLSGDLSRQYYPWFLELHRSLHLHQLPLWIPQMGTGYPLLAEGEIGAFYPINWLLIGLFSPITGFKLFFLIHSIIATLGMYFLIRIYRKNGLIAIFSGLVYA